MNPTDKALNPHLEDRLERAKIDASTRSSVMLLLGSACIWLVIGSGLLLIAGFKLIVPGFLDSLAFFTFGRVQPAALNLLVYGWASQAAIGVGIWLMARLSRAPLRHHTLLNVAVIFWNFAVMAGFLAVLAGGSTGIEWLEFPNFASRLLFVAYLLIGLWALIIFRSRSAGYSYVSQWYLLAAFLCFPWMYASANLLLTWQPVQGSAQGPIAGWYANALFALWLTPVGLASAYYFLPKVIGRPIYSYSLSILGFWTLVTFSGWMGMKYLIGGPVPAWMVSATVASSLLMLIPVSAVAINHHMTLKGHFDVLHTSPTLRFTVFGAVSYTLSSAFGILITLPDISQIANFTDIVQGQNQFVLYAFFSMMMFGAMYYMVPRLVGWEWPSLGAIRWHFWLSAIGVMTFVICFYLGGMVQGFAISDPGVQFIASVQFASPFRVLGWVGLLLMTAGNVIFAVHLGAMWLKLGFQKKEPTLFDAPAPEEEVVAV